MVAPEIDDWGECWSESVGFYERRGRKATRNGNLVIWDDSLFGLFGSFSWVSQSERLSAQCFWAHR